jgi:hypothetical protein
MDVVELIRNLATATRVWRERVFQELQLEGCSDLSHRPRSGMSSVGWLFAHQAAAYDYVLNMLILGNPPKNPELFYLYRGDSNDKGDWAGTSFKEINDYFDSAERNFLSWFERTTDEELNRILAGSNIPQYFHGKRVIEVIADLFVHLNHHNGHLSAIKGDWCRQKKGK